jgi:hypothetical protein
MGAIGAHTQANAASQAASAQTALANQMSGFAKDRMSMSSPAIAQAMKYYSTLTSGSRQGINAALAPQTAQLTSQMKGAQSMLNARMHPGAARDEALAGLVQQNYGMRGLMPMQARTDAAAQLAKMGNEGYNQAGQMLYGASRPLSAAYDANKEGMNAWSNFGSSMYTTLSPYIKGTNKWSDLWGGGKDNSMAAGTNWGGR